VSVALATPLVHILGDRTAAPLAAALGLHTVGDLLRHYPRRYAERGRLTGFDELVVGEYATVFAEVRSVATRQLRPKLRKTDVVVADDRGETMKMAMFNRYKADKELRAGRRAFFAGKVERFNRTVQLANPEYHLVDDDAGQVGAMFAGGLVPIYPATAKVSTVTLQKSVRTVLEVVEVGADPLPPELRLAHGLPGLLEALRKIHEPAGWPDVTRARTRLTWDEAFVLQVVLAQRRAALRALPGVPRVPRADGVLAAFDASLPFALTAGQAEVGAVLRDELARSVPMNRLLQGEVGSGKTLVALRAMLAVVDAGGQAALLAPTEVLAQQHARSLRALLGPLAQAGELGGADTATRVALLTGSQSTGVRRRALLEAASGQAGIVVGTHALLSENVQFADLGLVVVDEQHRFGVEQRDALRAKGRSPHVLVMTATPIPRTVAMTVYGDLEVSTLTELPAGRSPIRSAVVPVAEHPQWLQRAWERIREAVEQGRQAFVVCPRIGEEDAGEEGVEGPPDEAGRRPPVAVAEIEPLLAQGPLAGLRLAQLHGRLPPEAKDDVMARVVAGEVDVLVATTVIEVGVDVPNATVMVVMDADRFGMSQLHQLRGRIGRGEHPGLCLLVTEAEEGSPSRSRVDAVAATADGFALSQLDLEQRREGDVLGSDQSGRRSSLRMLQLLRHTDVILAARQAAVELVDADPDLSRHPALRAAVRSILDEERAAFLDKA
jgi:ATP-dependent DNA helicase RecG